MSEREAAFGILESGSEILLVANYRDLERGRVLCWDLPGGGIEHGESTDAACVREFFEETGVVVRVQELAFVVERFGFRGRDARERSRFFFFYVTPEGDWNPTLFRPTDTEIVDVGFRPIAELRRLCPERYQEEFHSWLESGRKPRYIVDRSGRL